MKSIVAFNDKGEHGLDGRHEGAKEEMTHSQKNGRGTIMNTPFVLNLIVAVFFLSILPVPSKVCIMVFSANLYAADQIKTEWHERSVELQTKKDWQRMLDWCRKWTKSEPESAGAWVCLGRAYSNLERDNDAIDAYRQALHIDPKYGSIWFFLGDAYDKLNRYNEAVEA